MTTQWEENFYLDQCRLYNILSRNPEDKTKINIFAKFNFKSMLKCSTTFINYQ